MKRKKHVDVDGLRAGDELDKIVALNIYGHLHDSSWFIDDKKRKKTQYFGPAFSTNYNDAMNALNQYLRARRGCVKSYCIVQQMEEGPYSCIAELRLPGEFDNLRYVRAWAPTLPLALARLLAKAPMK